MRASEPKRYPYNLFPCPSCHGASEVVETRFRENLRNPYNPQGWMYRLRRCRQCGQRFSTREMTYQLIKKEDVHDAIHAAPGTACRTHKM